MFIFDFVAETILDQILDWIYGKIIGFLNDFFVMMNNMGVELFALPWVEAVTTFFSYFGWALFGVGLVVGAFECAIEYQGGRGSIKDTAMNYIKGFMAVTGRMINLLKLVWQTPHLAEWTTTNVLHLHAKLLLLLKTIFPSLATITHGIHMIRFFLEWDIISLIVNYDTVLVLKQCKQNLTK